MKEKRKFPRKDTNAEMRIFTSLVAGPYTAKLRNISKGGAFIITPYIPQEGEVISYEFIDENLKRIDMGNARVCRVKDRGLRNYKGFGVEFLNPLNDELIDFI